MRDKLLVRLARVHANHPWRMLLIVVILTLIFSALASQLSVTMRWSDLLPSGDRRTEQFNKIIDEFASATSIIVVVQGEEQRTKQFADKLAPRLLAAVDTSRNAELQAKIDQLIKKISESKSKNEKAEEIAELEFEIATYRIRMNKKLIRRLDYKTEVDFLRNHGLMLIKEQDLKNMKDIFKDPNLTGLLVNLNNSMEKEYIGQKESISTREKEDQAVIFLDGIQNLVQLMQRVARDGDVSDEEVRSAVDKLLIGEPYLLSYDKKALIMNAIPNFTMMDTDLLVAGTDAIQAIVDDLLQEFPDLKAGLTGMIPVGRDEMVYSQQSLGYTSLIAFIAILALLIISLRMWVAPVFAMLNLIIGIVWAIGTVAIVVGQLNIMTQMMSVILLGLGIDFSIHLISGFTEWRAAGDTIAGAMQKTFLKSGKGVVTGALTTAFAFLTMIISSSRGMKEMGLVTAAGLLAILICTFLLLPILLVLRERFIEKRREMSNMQKHETILGSLHIIFSILVTAILLLGCASLLPDQESMALNATIGFVMLLIIALFGIGVPGGIGLIIGKSWGRIPIRILGYLYLIIIPIGTALGIYTIWILMKVKKPVQRDISFRSLGHIATGLSKHYVFTLVASVLITLLLIGSGSKITFDQNYMNIEPEGLTSIALHDTVLDKFDLSMDYALILTDNPAQSREFAKKYRELGSVALTEDISLYLPSPEQQKKRNPHIKEIHEEINSASVRPAIHMNELPILAQEIERLQMNIMEMQDMAFLGGQDKVDNKCKKIVGDPDNPASRNLIQELQDVLASNNPSSINGLSKFQAKFAAYFKESAIKMCSTEPIRLEELPNSILDRYCNQSRTQFLVTVFPAGNIWTNAEFLERFVDDLERISDRATGMPPVFWALIEIIGRDGRNALLLTLVIVFILLLLDFRRPGLALMAMIPLALGVIWMVGLMYLTGQQFTVMNIMGLPMILGIGIDDGVHIVHRWIHEGQGKIHTVFSSTGKAILLTSLTTMLAFGSLIFSIWRGFGHLGGALLVGVGACFLTTVIILSGIIGVIERKKVQNR